MGFPRSIHSANGMSPSMKPRVIMWLQQLSIGSVFYQAFKSMGEVDLGSAKLMSDTDLKVTPFHIQENL